MSMPTMPKTLGSGNKNIAGAGYDINRLNGLRAIGHGSNGPCAANAVYLVNIKQMRSRKMCGLTVPSLRGGVNTARRGTPDTWAGMALMSRLETRGVLPP